MTLNFRNHILETHLSYLSPLIYFHKPHNCIRIIIIFLILDNVKMNTIVEFHENISKD